MGLSLAERLRPGVFLRTGHRGARGLAPENTLRSFERAVEEGIDILELDVRETADGEVVVIHDATVDRTTDGKGAVSDLTLAELRELDAGFRFTLDEGATFPERGRGVGIPLLAEVLDSFGEHLVTVEVKGSPRPAFLPRVAAVIAEHGAGRVIGAAFQHRTLRRLRQAAPDLITSLSSKEIRNFCLLSFVRLAFFSRSPGRVLQVPTHTNYVERKGLRLVTRGRVRAAHRTGRVVQVWTINDPDEMRELLDMGVDGLTTDRPDLLNDVLRGRGRGVNPAPTFP